MASFIIQLRRKEYITQDTMAFYFEKPQDFTYQAGQYGNFILINPPETDAEGNARNFSFASAPHEPDIMIATRLRDTAFKRTLKNMSVGDVITLEGPYGSFKLPKNPATPAVFLAGGIGATFVRSIVNQTTHEASSQKIIFFYANRSAEDAVFMDKFAAYSQQNAHFTCIPTMTGSPKGQWNGEQGTITIGMLRKYLPDISTPIYYISGSGAMVVAMRTMLMAAEVNKFNIRSDQFIGY